MHDDARLWLLAWFQRRNTSVAFDWQRDAHVNYFDAGWADSFSAIQLVDDMESHFRIRFNEAALNDERFGTMSGLLALLQEQVPAPG